MNSPSSWREVKAKARIVDPEWDNLERLARRTQMRERMLASVGGAHLTEVRREPCPVKGSSPTTPQPGRQFYS